MLNATLPASVFTHTTSGIIAPETAGYIEITRKPRKPKQRRAVNWMDMPLVYGQQGFEIQLTGSDKATLAFLYGDAVRMNHIEGKWHRVTMVTPTVEG